MSEGIPAEVVFNPNWWFHNYKIGFDQSFYFDKEVRIRNDVTMRRAMYERFGLGEENPQPRPIIGSAHVAGGFVMPALFDAEIRFGEAEAPWPVALDLSKEEILALEVPDIETTWPMDCLIADMDALEDEFGYVVGDFDTDGILNTALCLRGQRLFIDFLEDSDLAHHLFGTLAETYALIADYMKSRTGTCAVATNRSILNVDPKIYLHSNCSVQMISAQTYERMLLASDLYLASKLQPYGIHHCGSNMHLMRDAYVKVPSAFFDVGWGSDVAACREALPDAFFSLRLSPIRMLRCSPDEIAADTERLLLAARPLEKAGVCCINMDYNTPDENIFAMFEVVERYRRCGAS